MPDIWLRPEYQGRENELETREGFEERTGITKESLASMFTRYSDWAPDAVKTFGKMQHFVISELDDFVRRIKQNPRPRTEVQIKQADLHRVNGSIKKKQLRLAVKEEEAERIRRDIAKANREAKKLQEDIDFLEQTK